MNLVVDCSFIMSSIFPDEVQAKIETIYFQILNNSYKVYVPAIFYLECNNTLISSLRRKRISQNNYDEYVRLLDLFPINIDKLCTTSESLYSIGKLANKYNLTSYDACYLELAIRREAKIATLDKDLAKSCRVNNVESLLNFGLID